MIRKIFLLCGSCLLLAGCTELPVNQPPVADHNVQKNVNSVTPPTKETVREVVKVPILMYHHIRNWTRQDKMGYGLSVPPAAFARQMQYLSDQHYQPITVHDLATNRLSPKPIVLTFDDGYADFYYQAWPILKKYHFTAVSAVILNRIGQPDFMTSQQIQTLVANNVELACHSWSHLDLTKLDEANLQKEAVDSCSNLRDMFQTPFETFVYPSGRYNEQVLNVVRKAGYLIGLTTKPGWADLSQDWLQLHRIRVNEMTNLDLALDPARRDHPLKMRLEQTGKDGPQDNPSKSPAAAHFLTKKPDRQA